MHADIVVKLILSMVFTAVLSLPPLAAAGQDYCFDEAGKQYAVAPSLLRAISEVESGFNPFAINFNTDGTYDYCHMQVNSSWASKIGRDTWASLCNPCQCTMVAAWILSQCIAQYGYTWKAVGCYHAKDNQRRVSYAWKIQDALKVDLRFSRSSEGKR